MGAVFRLFLDQLRGFFRQGLPPNSPAAYAFAVGCVGITILARLAFTVIVGGVALFAIYFPAVLLSSLVGGASAGAVALILGGLAAWAGLMSPSFATFVPTLPQGVGLATYLLSGALVIWVADSYRRAVRRLHAEEARRRLLLSELQHRSANTLMVVQAIVSQTLRSNKTDAEKIVSRIRALAATNDLLTRSVAQTADLRDILAIELKPYGEARIAMQGEAVALVPELARALALVFHELATNAAKYGALSQPDGRLLVSWSVLPGCCQIKWFESGGPPVQASPERGFGTTLLEHILDSYQGKVDIYFQQDGVLCDISFELPSAAPALALEAASLRERNRLRPATH
jgi:two-component sensor histidine kinase